MNTVETVGKSVDSTMIALGTKSMGGGTISLILGYLSSSGFAVLLGIILTLLGFISTQYFQRRQNLRNKEKWELERAQLKAEEERRKELHELQLARIRAEMRSHEKQC